VLAQPVTSAAASTSALTLSAVFFIVYGSSGWEKLQADYFANNR
jgi:hypothetical protein